MVIFTLILFLFFYPLTQDFICFFYFQCRETFIGQEIYRLVIVDFIFILLTTFFLEFIRR